MQLGFTLDIARKYYSPDDLIQLISMLADREYSFLHLHISDDENYGIESALLNQTTANAALVDGTYICITTGGKFLSICQLEKICAFAWEKGIEIIPEIDSPAHLGGIWKLYENMYGWDSLKTLRVDSVNELNMSVPMAVPFMTALYSEVIATFGGVGRVRHFHIGGDEFGGAETLDYLDFVTYANQLIMWLNQRGITARLWNDGITKYTISKMQGNFEVTYWTAGRHGRCSMKELIDFGVCVFNYNCYYLYFLPGKNGDGTDILTADIEKAASDIEQIWEPGVWDANHLETAFFSANSIAGASLALWGEYAAELRSNDIISCSRRLIEGLTNRLTNQ